MYKVATVSFNSSKRCLTWNIIAGCLLILGCKVITLCNYDNQFSLNLFSPISNNFFVHQGWSLIKELTVSELYDGGEMQSHNTIKFCGNSINITTEQKVLLRKNARPQHKIVHRGPTAEVNRLRVKQETFHPGNVAWLQLQSYCPAFPVKEARVHACSM